MSEQPPRSYSDVYLEVKELVKGFPFETPNGLLASPDGIPERAQEILKKIEELDPSNSISELNALRGCLIKAHTNGKLDSLRDLDTLLPPLPEPGTSSEVVSEVAQATTGSEQPTPASGSTSEVPATESVSPVPTPEAPPVVEPQNPTSAPVSPPAPEASAPTSPEKSPEIDELKRQISELKDENGKIKDAFNRLIKANIDNRDQILEELRKVREDVKGSGSKTPTTPAQSNVAPEARKTPAESAPAAETKEAPKAAPENASPKAESVKEKPDPKKIFTEKNKVLDNHQFDVIVDSLASATEKGNGEVIAGLRAELDAIADEPEFREWRHAYGHEYNLSQPPTVEEANVFARQYKTYKAHREIFFKSEGIKSELVTFVNMSLMDAYKSYIPLTKEDAQVLEGKLDDLVNPQELDLSGEDGLNEFRQKIEQVNRIDASMQNIRMKLIPEFDKAHRRLFAEARSLGLEKELNAQAGFEGVRPGSAERMIEVLDTMLADADSLEAELSEHKTKGMKGTRQEAIAGFFAKYDGLMNAFGFSGPDFFQAMKFYFPWRNISVNAFKEKIQEIRSVVDSKKKTYREAADSLKNERQQIIETLGAQEFIARVAQEKVIKKLTKARNAMFSGLERGGLKLEADSALAQAELARTFEELGDDPSDVSGLGEILKNAPVRDVDGNMTTAREARINQGTKAIGQMIGTYLSEMSTTRNKEFQGFMSLIDGQLKRDKFGEEKGDKQKTIISALRDIQLKLAADKADDRVARRKREYVKRAIDTLEARIDPAKVKGARTK
jgi:hypothetical protein